MCGIAGFCGQTTDNMKTIKRMCNQMVHRGPNAEGYWADVNVNITLGHRRLSILDLSENGSQPMESASGRFVICYNGEIYNFSNIRKKMENDGFSISYKSSSDTEVILEAFEVYGLEAVKLMKGMFAIALYDRKEQTLHLMRDRMGEKPLYYGKVGNQFVFASDLSCFYVLDDFDNQINREALAAFIRYKSVPQPLSIYEHIYKLIPGQILSIKAPFTTPVFSTYWSLKECVYNGMSNPFTGSEEEAKEELRRLLKDAVHDQMISDVPIGAFLSGGIDSPLIVSIMQSLCEAPVKTFTIGFDNPKYNEATFAKDIANHLGTDHTELYITENDLKEVIPILPSIYTEPLGDPACLPSYLVSKLAKSKVTVSLSGDGGDELFCGYNIYNQLEQRWSKISKVPYGIRKMGGTVLQSFPFKYQNKLYNMGEYASLGNRNQLHELFRNEHTYDAHFIVPDICNPRDYLAGAWTQEDANLLPDMAKYQDYISWNDVKLDYRSAMLYRDQIGYLNDTNLNKVDRAGMKVSLENRIPLLDKDIIEFAWSLPIEYKSSNGCNKKILKELLYDYVPQSMLDRPKHGFEVPLPEWLSTGELHDWAGELMLHSKLAESGMLDKKVLSRIWKEFNDSRSNTLLLWYILQAEAWYRHRKDY